MTDNLRTRIAAVQLAHMGDAYEQDMGECPCGVNYSTRQALADHLADVMIRELGLTKMRRATGWTEDGTLCYRSCYRTEWTADD